MKFPWDSRTHGHASCDRQDSIGVEIHSLVELSHKKARGIDGDFHHGRAFRGLLAHDETNKHWKRISGPRRYRACIGRASDENPDSCCVLC